MIRAVRHIDLPWLTVRLIAFGVGLALFAAIQKSFDYGNHHVPVYGFWTRSLLGNPYGPFINRNHFAGWMVLVFPLAMGYACAVLESAPRPRNSSAGRWLRWLARPEASRFELATACVFVMATSIFLSGSRSGMASAFVALVVFAWFVLRRVGGQRGRLLAAAVVALFLAGTVAWAGTGRIADRFSQSVLLADAPGRIGAWRNACQIIADFPWFGTGMGSFGLAMLVYQTGARNLIYYQAHNDYLQLAAEGGLLVTLPALATLGIVVSTIVRRVRGGDASARMYWLRAGAVAGLAGMAAQSLVEFSLQMPGITMLFIVLLAIAMRRPDDSSPSRSRVPGDMVHAHRV